MKDPAWLKIASVFLITVFLLNALIPFSWIVLNSLKGENEVFAPRAERTLLPDNPTLENYRTVLTRNSDLPAYFTNSAIVTAITVAGMLLLSVLGAYAFARFSFKGKEIAFAVFMGLMMIPGEGLLVSLYDMMYHLGLLNTLAGLILPLTAFTLPVAIFVLRNVFETIPKDLEDAARIDGCGALRVLWHVIVPNAHAGIATVVVLTFLHAWNDFGLPLVLTRDARSMTLTVGVAQLKDQFGNYDIHLLCAVIVLGFLPTTVLFILAQRTFVKGLLAGAIKG